MIDFRNTYDPPAPKAKQSGSLDFNLTAAELEAAAFNQAQLRFDAALRNAEDAKREGRA